MGTFKGVRRVYQQSFIDTYSKAAFAKLYLMKTPIAGADSVEGPGRSLLRETRHGHSGILTDRGGEYNGRADQHDYQLYPGDRGHRP